MPTNVLILAVSFALYSVIGWLIDSAWRSLRKGRWVRGGYSKYPFSPIYGLGALFAVALALIIIAWPLWVQWLFLSLLLGAYEYASGVVILKTMKRRLWNYADEPFDLKGHTTPFYALVWGALGLAAARLVQPLLERLLSLLL